MLINGSKDDIGSFVSLDVFRYARFAVIDSNNAIGACLILVFDNLKKMEFSYKFTQKMKSSV